MEKIKDKYMKNYDLRRALHAVWCLVKCALLGGWIGTKIGRPFVNGGKTKVSKVIRYLVYCIFAIPVAIIMSSTEADYYSLKAADLDDDESFDEWLEKREEEKKEN